MDITILKNDKVVNFFMDVTYFEIVKSDKLYLTYHANGMEFAELKFEPTHWDSITINND